MRKPIDRAAVRKQIKERLALRRWTDKDMDGYVIPGEAFGAGIRLDTPVWQSECMKSKDYPFTIVAQDGFLNLEVDTYTAAGLPAEGSEFDVDAWDGGKLYLQANAISRDAFQELHRVARVLISGGNICLNDGTVISGVKKQGEVLPC